MTFVSPLGNVYGPDSESKSSSGYQSLLASLPAEIQPGVAPKPKDDRNWFQKGLSAVLDNPVGQAVTTTLMALDIPRAMALSTLVELHDVFTDPDGWEQDDWAEQAFGAQGVGDTGRSLGFGDLLEDTDLPHWAKVAGGFAGDVLTDPLTYVTLGTAKLGGGAAKLTDDALRELTEAGARVSTKKASRGMVFRDQIADIVRNDRVYGPLVERYGKAKVDDVTERILRQKSGAPLRELPEFNNIFNREFGGRLQTGVSFGAGKYRVFAGGERVADEFSKITSKLKDVSVRRWLPDNPKLEITPGTRAFKKNVAGRKHPYLLAYNWERAVRGSNMARTAFRSNMDEALNTLDEFMDGVDDELVINKIESATLPELRVAASAADATAEDVSAFRVREFLDTAAQEFEKRTGTKLRQIDQFFPHSQTEEMQELLAEGHRVHLPKRRWGKFAQQMERKYKAGDDWMGITLQEGTLDEMHAIARRVMGEDYVQVFKTKLRPVVREYTHKLSNAVRYEALDDHLRRLGMEQFIPDDFTKYVGRVEREAVRDLMSGQWDNAARTADQPVAERADVVAADAERIAAQQKLNKAISERARTSRRREQPDVAASVDTSDEAAAALARWEAEGGEAVGSIESSQLLADVEDVEEIATEALEAVSAQGRTADEIKALLESADAQLGRVADDALESAKELKRSQITRRDDMRIARGRVTKAKRALDEAIEVAEMQRRTAARIANAVTGDEPKVARARKAVTEGQEELDRLAANGEQILRRIRSLGDEGDKLVDEADEVTDATLERLQELRAQIEKGHEFKRNNDLKMAELRESLKDDFRVVEEADGTRLPKVRSELERVEADIAQREDYIKGFEEDARARKAEFGDDVGAGDTASDAVIAVRLKLDDLRRQARELQAEVARLESVRPARTELPDPPDFRAQVLEARRNYAESVRMLEDADHRTMDTLRRAEEAAGNEAAERTRLETEIAELRQELGSIPEARGPQAIQAEFGPASRQPSPDWIDESYYDGGALQAPFFDDPNYAILEAFDLDTVTDDMVDEFRTALLEGTQRSLRDRGLPEEFWVFRAGPLSTKGDRINSTSLRGDIGKSFKGDVVAYKVRREDVLVDTNAFARGFEGEEELLIDTDVLENAPQQTMQAQPEAKPVPEVSVPERIKKNSLIRDKEEAVDLLRKAEVEPEPDMARIAHLESKAAEAKAHLDSTVSAAEAKVMTAAQARERIGWMRDNLDEVFDLYEEGFRRMSRGRWMLPETHEAYENLRKLKEIPNSRIMKWYDGITARWKAYALISPGFHIRNFTGGFFNNLLDGVQTKSYYTFAKAYREMRKELRRLGGYKSGASLYDALEGVTDPQVKDIMREMLDGADFLRPQGNALSQNVRDQADLIDLAERSGTKGIAAHLRKDISHRARRLDPTDMEFGLIQLNFMGAGGVERHLRATQYLDNRLRGLPEDVAWDKVRKFHFNYDELSEFERVWMRRVVPFYTWTRKNFPLQLEMMFRRPGIYQAVNHFRRNIALGVEQDDVVPAYYEEMMAAATPFTVGPGGLVPEFNLEQPTGDDARIYATLDLPFRDLAKTLDPGNIIGMMNPILKTPLEVSAGKQFFSDVPFSNYLQDAPSFPGDDVFYSVLEQLDGNFGLPRAKRADDGTWQWTSLDQYKVESAIPSFGKAHRLTGLMPFIEGKETYENRSLQYMLSTLFGLSTVTNDPTAQRGEQIRRDKELEKAIARAKGESY